MVVRSCLNKDEEQHGSLFPDIHISIIYNLRGYNQARGHDYYRRGNTPRDFIPKASAKL
ncbi:MAG: hypothetical protein V6013_01960 [Candidatus Dasytiphilus stammeri]